jgi:hypothetical protein
MYRQLTSFQEGRDCVLVVYRSSRRPKTDARIRSRCCSQGDERHQGGELLLAVVLGASCPRLVRDTTGGISDAGAADRLPKFRSELECGV